MNSAQKILLFIPFYQCEKQIFRVLASVKKYEQYFDRILIVDNISRDQGVKVAVESVAKLPLKKAIVIRNRQNNNLGGSHKVAFNYALEHGFTHLVVLHGDDQASVSDLIPHLEAGSHLKYDCLLGARFHPQSTLVGYSRFRIFGNLVLNLFCSLVCRQKVLDMGSGLNMYQVEFLKDKKYMHFPNDLTFNASLLFHTYLTRKTILYIPICWREEDQVSNARVFRQMWIIMKLIFRTILSPAALYPALTKADYSYEVIKTEA